MHFLNKKESMKHIIILAIMFVVIGCDRAGRSTSNPKVYSELEQLVNSQDYFKLKNTFDIHKNELSKTHALYFSAIINNVFNKAAISNLEIEKLLEAGDGILNDTLLNKLYRTKLLNHINLYEYEEASLCTENILNKFKTLNDSVEIQMLENEINIWSALKDVMKQEIRMDKDITFPMARDKVGLFNIDVTIGDSTENFLFDTGANFSVIIRSLAEKLGLKIIDSDFYVTAATGKQVESDLAVAPELSIGGIILENVVFLVMNDEDLSFPQISYYPNGAIGFPVIEAMNEIRISKDNRIFVPQIPVAYSYDNFALDGLMPIVAVEYERDTLRFHLDTGATSTSMFPLFYKDYRQEIEKNYKKVSFSAGSGGGVVEFGGYILNNISLKIADSFARIDSVNLHTEDIGDEESNFHGNLGQDFIRQFDEMIISFKYSSLLFK